MTLSDLFTSITHHDFPRVFLLAVSVYVFTEVKKAKCDDDSGAPGHLVLHTTNIFHIRSPIQ